MTTKQNILSLAELEEIILAIPTKMEPVFLDATQDGYKVNNFKIKSYRLSQKCSIPISKGIFWVIQSKEKGN